MRTMHLFAGIGGGILGAELLGHTPVCAVEIDPYCQSVLKSRQRDGSLPEFPIFGDIKEFDAAPWRDQVDVVAGGFPCVDLSVAGSLEGMDGERSGLCWSHMVRVIRDVAPLHVFVENVPGLLVRGMDRVLGDLAEQGFDAEWTVLSAADQGAVHLRRRVWILATHPERALAYAGRKGLSTPQQSGQGRCRPPREYEEWQATAERTWWSTERNVVRVVTRLSRPVDRVRRVDRIKSLGNAQVPQCAAQAWRVLMEMDA